MLLDIFLLSVLVLSALWTVMTRSILRSAIGLALTSVVLTIVMFRLHAPLAAVFELSVCAGLISVLFISTISLTQPYTNEEILQRMKDMYKRFKYLPLLLVGLGVFLFFARLGVPIPSPAGEVVTDARIVLWNLRSIDILGQILVLLIGVFGVVILFKERVKK